MVRAGCSAAGERLAGVADLRVVVVCVLIGLYVGVYLTTCARRPPRRREPPAPTGTQLYLATVAASELSGSASVGGSRTTCWPTHTDQNWRHPRRHSCCRRTPTFTSRSTSSTASPVCATRSSRSPAARSEGTSVLDRQAPAGDRPRCCLACVRDRGVRVLGPAPGHRRRRQEPVQQRALSVEHRSPHDLVHVHTGKRGLYRWQCYVPVRGGVHRRVGRSDADRRLHGRLHQGGVSQPVREPNHLATRRRWSGCSAPGATPLVVVVLRPVLPRATARSSPPVR